MENIKKVIEAQISGNEAGLNWTKSYIKELDESREIRKECLTNQLILNRIAFANDFNPAVAVYGESQVGKSYLVDNLLTTVSRPLNIYDGTGKQYGFIESINPIGGGKESTSLISRFTINRYSDNADYPICAVMLTPIDIVLILCDAYYNDVKKQKFPETPEVKETVIELRKRYCGKTEVQNIIKDVDIFEIKDYFESTEFAKADSFISSLMTTEFFETLSECIKSINISEWREVFEYLWNRNPLISDVFDKLIATLKGLGFAKKCYIKIDPLLRKDGTILQVDRLYELFGLTEVQIDGKPATVDMARVKEMDVWNGEKVVKVQKSEFCALTTEVVFTIADEKNGEADKAQLLKEKPFLEYMDVLDFPGARSRKLIDAEEITKSETCLMLLRGKVAYLFNKYSKQFLISNLMFCHHDLKSEVSTLSGLLSGWIHSTIGRTPEERADYIRASEISPLFIVGTKFNTDLVRQPIDSIGSEEEKEQVKKARWVKRFNSTLGDLIHETPTDPWLSEWTPGRPFKNMYLLRAYNYSCQSGIYVGYQKKNEQGDWVDDKRSEVSITPEYQPFLKELKRTFLANDFVQAHFEDPGKSWEQAVELNHDGSAWIIENLTKAAHKANASRERRFDILVKECFERLYNVLRKKYHDDKADSNLREALTEAGHLDLSLDALFGMDKYFFSEFLGTMLVDEEDLHDVVINAINSIVVNDKTDLSVLFAIRDRAGIAPDDTEESARNKLRNAYHLMSDVELDEFLKNYGLTMDDIINPPRVMNIGRIIVTAVEKKWFEEHLKKERFEPFVARGLASSSIAALFTRMRTLYYDELNMTERITEQIKPYISSPQQLDEMVDMLADLISEDINRFVNSMGTAYFGSGLWSRLKETVEFNKFDININVAEEDDITWDEDDAKKETVTVFDIFDNFEEIESYENREKREHLSNYKTFRLWTERMKVAYLAICGVPQYDVNANNALKAIFQNRIVGVEELKPLITSAMDVSCFIENK